MNTALERKIVDFENKRNSLLDEMTALDKAKLTERPLEGKWSILEILEHLVVAEREVMGGLVDFAEFAEQERSFKTRLLYPLVMRILKWRIPVKVPSKKMLPQSELTLADIRRMWDENQEWLRGFLAGLNEERLEKAYFVHPVAGALTAAEALDMCHAHIDSHTAQIRKRLELLG